MKKLLSILLAMLMVFSLVGCSNGNGGNGGGNEPAPAENTVDPEKVVNIWAWNNEFWNFLVKYYADEKIDDTTVKKGDYVIKLTTYPSDGGAYQDALDAALLNQENAPTEDKVDIFLAEADYILKYTDSDATLDVKSIGVTDFSNTYPYTVQAASDTKGVVKGVSFQCCPAVVIYRRSIAKDVLGTDDPAEVQAALDSWDKFDAVAAQAKEKGYNMVASPIADYRVFSNNASSPWVVDGKLNIDPAIESWMEQAETYTKEGYAKYAAGVWSEEQNSEMLSTGTSMCFFGPAWYFNFSMENAQKDSSGDWAICEGPAPWFWGGTWMLAANGTDNPDVVADIMNTFINNEEVCSKLVTEENQFVNNKAVNNKFAADESFGVEFLGGQNATAVFAKLADGIKFANVTNYDQLCNEKLQEFFLEYLQGSTDKETALNNFKEFITTTYPTITAD